MKTPTPSNRIAVTLLTLLGGCVTVPSKKPAEVAPLRPACASSQIAVLNDDLSRPSHHSSDSLQIFPASFTLEGETQGETAPLVLDELGMTHLSPVLTLNQLEQLAIENNPSIAVANANLNMAKGLRSQVGVRPNPMVGYFGSQLADEGTDQQGVFFEQEFVRGGKLQLNTEVLRHTTSAQRCEAEVQRHRVLTDVRLRFYEAAAAQKQLEATREFAQLASRGVDVAADRLKAEEASKVELLQSKILLSEITLAMQQYTAAYHGAWKELATIVGIPESQPIQLADAFSFSASARDWELTHAELLAQSPELAVAQAIVCEKQANLQRQKVQATPNVIAQFAAGYDNATDSGMINLQIGAPIPVNNRNVGSIAAAYADYTRALENVRRIELSIRARLARVMQEYEAAIASVQQYEQEILPNAKESLVLSEEAYAAGEFDFLQVLIVRQRYFDSTLAFIESQAKFAQANAKIEGLLLTGGLESPQDYTAGDGLRSQSFGGQ